MKYAFYIFLALCASFVLVLTSPFILIGFVFWLFSPTTKKSNKNKYANKFKTEEKKLLDNLEIRSNGIGKKQ